MLCFIAVIKENIHTLKRSWLDFCVLRVLYWATFSSSLELVATKNFWLTTKILDCFGEVNHVNWWIYTTRNLLRIKLNYVSAELGSVNSTIGMYLELDKIIYTCNLNLISRLFRNSTYIPPTKVFPVKIYPIETISSCKFIFRWTIF